jgi:hypothetical protein
MYLQSHSYNTNQVSEIVSGMLQLFLWLIDLVCNLHMSILPADRTAPL